MDTLEAINTRRSIRKYKKELISDETVMDILKAADHAPSANNGKPWEFIIIRDRETLYRMSVICKHWTPLKNTNLCIVVVANLREYPCSHIDFYIQDCAACTENLLLAAHALGLGAVWMGCCPAEERMQAIREVLEIPPSIMPFSVVPMGVPDEKTDFRKKISSVIIHYNKYKQYRRNHLHV